MIIRTDTDRKEFINKAQSVDLSKQAWEFKAAPYKRDRSAAQNALINKWYRIIGKHTGNGFTHERGYCKWHFGTPIIEERGKPEFKQLLQAIVNSLTYEATIELFGKESIAISSIMNIKEGTEYINRMEHYGISVGAPLQRDDDYNEAMR